MSDQVIRFRGTLRFTGRLKYEVILSIDRLVSVSEAFYSVKISIGEITRRPSTSQIGVPHNKLRQLKLEARKLVAKATRTKLTSWTAEVVDDQLVIVTRRGKAF